jgi:D-alanyl-lipoteichoic acid acyltransferase DltB (MBOAT superfamily)
MLFQTTTFLIFFLIFLPFYALARRRRSVPLVVLAFSQVFYGWWDWRFLILLWITIFTDFFLAQRLAAQDVQWKRKAYLATSFTISLSLLGFFKYWNFFVDTAVFAHLPAGGAHIPTLILPVGISFYTFQSLSYIFDVYRGVHQPVRNLITYASFVCYFPQLVAGPIQRVGHLLPQLIRPAPVTIERVYSGVALFSYGYFMKALGDAIAQLINPVFSDLDHASPSSVVAAIFGFGLQIYFDFNGYTQMARGVSRVLGIELTTNFRSPYLASSFRDFWTRWHISLSQWLRDYVYIPLGGNRAGTFMRYRNLMLTMLIGGLWHGAGWNFVIWGGLQGTYLVVNTVFDHSRLGRSTVIPHLVRATAGWAITFIGVMYAWLYFRIRTFDGAMTANRKIWEWLTSGHLSDWSSVPWGLALLVLVVVVVDILRRNAKDLWPVELAGARRTLAFGAMTGAFFTIGLVLLAATPARQFIYFQF